MTGHNSDGLQGTPPMSYQVLWGLVLGGLVLGAIGFVYAGLNVANWRLSMILYTFAALFAFLVFSTLVTGFRIDDSGLRIVWQLTKGLGVGVILLAGCLLIFKQQGGNVLLHIGVGLLMLGQFIFGDRQLEQRLSLVEGESTNTLINLDSVELTFIRDEEGDQIVTVIPASRLQPVAGKDELIRDD